MGIKKSWGWLALVLCIVIGLNIKVPYYLNQPGSAISLAPIIEVEGGDDEEKGTFRLTTIRTGPTNVAGVLWSLFNSNADLVDVEKVHSPHENNEQYLQRQLVVMQDSQDTAKIVAFQKAGYDVGLKNSGAMIMQIIPGYPAADALKIGDVITSVNDKKVETASDLIQVLKGRKVNETVQLTFLRSNKEHTVDLTLKSLPVQGEENSKPGIGISSPITKREYVLPKEVKIKSDKIGGPSAGFMFALEMMSQLTEGDMTKGYNIAGTGTIKEDGSVGRIGGIQYKIVAADREGVEIFFAPMEKDETGVSNYDVAVEKAKAQNIKMKIVPVNHIDDAISYLEHLPPKE